LISLLEAQLPLCNGISEVKMNSAATSAVRQATANPKDSDALVLEHLALVKIIAASMRGSLPSFIDLDDLVQAGTLGLMDAARKFTADKQVDFPAYAKHRIRGAILDSLRRNDNASRDMRRWQKRIEAATSELSAELHRAPDDTEIARKLELDVKRFRAIMVRIRSLEQVSASSRRNEDLPEPEFPTQPAAHPDSICAKRQLNGVLVEAIKALPSRHQSVVRLYYSGGMTMREIGNRLGVNESRVSQVHSLAIGRLEQLLRANNINSSAAL
jgi:RNA polymerase sigma factor for flagellar operon FliA